MNKIDWCEGGLQLADIGTKNVGETWHQDVLQQDVVFHGKTWELKTEHLYKRGDSVLASYEEQEFWID